MNFSNVKFDPVIHLPDDYAVLDFSKHKEASFPKSQYSIGKYNEVRPHLYQAEQYEGGRNIHMGVDIGGPVGTPVHAFYSGEIFLFGYNDLPLDYGHTLVTKHHIEETELYVLWGHLSKESLKNKEVGQSFQQGDVLGWLGGHEENGGWPPHLHFQLSLKKPTAPDLPGVVSSEDLEEALKVYPDPRLILGPLY